MTERSGKTLEFHGGAPSPTTSLAGSAQGLPRLSPLVVGMANLYSRGLLMTMLAAVFRGFRRERRGEA